MTDNHTGIYLCLITLIILVAGCLAVLIYNSGVRLPERTEQSESLSELLTPEQKEMMPYFIVGLGLCLVSGLIGLFLVTKR